MTIPVKVVGPDLREGVRPVAVANYLPVANGTHFNGNWGGPVTDLVQTRCRQSRKLLRVISSGACNLQIEWANIYTTTVAPSTDASCEINGPNSVIVRMAIEYPAGTPRLISGSTAYSAGTAYAVGDQIVYSSVKYVCIQAGTGQTPSSSPLYWRVVNTYPVQWEGQSDSSGTVTFAAGAYKKSLPIKLSEKTLAGDKIAILGAFDSGGSSGTYIPYAGANGAANHGQFVDWVVDAAGGMPAIGSSIVETGITTQTNGNTTTANNSNNQNWMKIPYATAITGDIPNNRCVAIFGDSIAQGFGGDMRDGEPCGLFPRALDGNTWWRVAQGGNRAQNYTSSNAPWQSSVLRRCTSVICAMGGLNDMMNSATYAQMKTYLARLWKSLASNGAPVYTGLLTPISSSTDSWATTTNQGRYTNGGVIPTTQFPTTADYASTVYGQTALWISQDGGSITDDAGNAIRAGQAGHPLAGILDWRMYMSDASTSWRWIATLTTDGAHPTPTSVIGGANLLAPELEPVITGRTTQSVPFPGWNTCGEPDGSLRSMERSMARDGNPTISTATMIATVVGTSPGKIFSQIRMAAGSGMAATAKDWTILSGADPAFLRVVASGQFTTGAGAAILTVILGSGVWIPAGHLIVACFEVPSGATASTLVGSNAAIAAIATTGTGCVLSGWSTDTAQLTGNINQFTKWTAHGFRAWAEMV